MRHCWGSELLCQTRCVPAVGFATLELVCKSRKRICFEYGIFAAPDVNAGDRPHLKDSRCRGSSTAMGCYCGLETQANRVKWLVAAVLFTLAWACLTITSTIESSCYKENPDAMGTILTLSPISMCALPRPPPARLQRATPLTLSEGMCYTAC